MSAISINRSRSQSQLSLSIGGDASPLDELLQYQGKLGARSRSFHERDFAAESNMSFPEALENFRNNAKRSHDPQIQFAFVRYLLDAALKVRTNPAELELDFTLLPGEGSPDDRRNKMLKVLESEALRWLKKLATSGNGMGKQPLADAQFMLAEVYGKGQFGMVVDHGKAFNLYLQASKQNHPTSTFRAAVCYELGAGTKRDNGRAVQFYRKAAALGDNLAMHKLSLILLYGKLNQRKNLKEGVTWLKRAANAATETCPEALHDLAQCYEKKGGCPVLIPDEHFAFELYARAAQFGLAASQYRLGTCYEYGLLGCPVDPSSSIKWYSKAAEQGFPDSELALSSWYLSGSHGILQQSDSDAYLWARKAADRGHAKAEYQVGTYYEIGIGVPADPSEAAKWYSKSAGKGHKRAAHRLAELKKSSKSKKAPQRCTIS